MIRILYTHRGPNGEKFWGNHMSHTNTPEEALADFKAMATPTTLKGLEQMALGFGFYGLSHEIDCPDLVAKFIKENK